MQCNNPDTSMDATACLFCSHVGDQLVSSGQLCWSWLAHFPVGDSAGRGLCNGLYRGSPALLHAPVLLLLGPEGQPRLDLLTAMDDRRASEQIPMHKPISSHYSVRSAQHTISWIWCHDGSCCLKSWQVILPRSGEHAWWHMWQRPWLQGEMVGRSLGDIFVAFSTLRRWHN